jgi:chorismate mutase
MENNKGDNKHRSNSALQPGLIAGPCSAETREQVMAAASSLRSTILGSGDRAWFRASLWKPRTRPGDFEGVGEIGLGWLAEVKAELGLKVATEVAHPRHVDMALKSGVDLLWVGARTTTSPFLVQELANALKGVDVAVAIKNPMHADLMLWAGAVERMRGAGLERLTGIHRGFSVHGQDKYRNPPMWQLAIDFKNLFPELPLYCDPSHITGRRDQVASVAQKAMDLGFDGLMIESHNEPEKAWTDAAQQITPDQLKELISGLVLRSAMGSSGHNHLDALETMRAELDLLDDRLIGLLVRRMEISGEIGGYKRDHGMLILQKERWNQILKDHVDKAVDVGLDRAFISGLYKLIHQASIGIQSQKMEASETVNKYP